MPATGPPPSADRMDRKAGCIVIGADADPADIVADVVDAIRHGAAQLGIDKVVNIDEFRRTLGAPFPAVGCPVCGVRLLVRARGSIV
jgi:hypothetical protein